MTRQEFIRKLQEALNGKLDAATIQDHLKFYDDYIIEEMRKGKSEQEVLELLGDPWAIAKTIVDASDGTDEEVEVTVLLDIEDANILREEAQVEESIRITSSLAARMVKNKMNLWVKSNAKDEETGEELRAHLAAGAGKTAELNRKLACVQLGGNLTGSAEFLHKEAEKELTGHTYVVVSKNRTDEVREALHLLSGAQNQVLWVIPYLPGEEVPSEQNRAYTAIGWEVKPWK